MIDLVKIRKDTPGTEKVIHFNNAGCALSPACVTAAVISHLELEQEIGGYEAAIEAQPSIDSFYLGFAELLNCSSEEIAFVENASRAWEIALHSIGWEKGDQIITGQNEYVSNFIGLLHLKNQKGVEIIQVPCAADGLIDLTEMRRAITPKTKMIALTHIASQRGDIQPAVEVGALAKEFNLLYLLDACQSVGHLKLDTQSLNCDFLCGTGRKYLRGPRGTGFLYANKNSLSKTNPVFLDNHSGIWTGPNSYSMKSDATRFETWERSIAGKIGLAKAVEYTNQLGIEAIESRIKELALELNAKLDSVPGIRVFERSTARSGIVTFQKQGILAAQLASMLRSLNINTSVAKQDNAQLDLAIEGTGDVNRASIHYYNSSVEIDTFIDCLKKM